MNFPITLRRYRSRDQVEPVARVHTVAGDRNDAFNTSVIAFLDRHLPAQPTAPAP